MVGLQIFFSFFFQFLFPPKNPAGMHTPLPKTVNAWPVRILLECILVLLEFGSKLDLDITNTL